MTWWRAVCHCGAVLYAGENQEMARAAAEHPNPHGLAVLQRSCLAWEDVEVIYLTETSP